MPRNKSIDELSASELYKLAEKREKQEQEKKIAANKARIETLKSQRKKLITAHRKEMAAIDRELKKLSGTATKKVKKGNQKQAAGTTNRILKLLKDNKSLTTAQIRAELEKNGQTINNLSQTLAYLKRTNRVTSPARSTYALV